MATLGELNEALVDLIKKNTPIVLRKAKVTELDKQNDTIDVQPLDDSPIFYGVKLRAIKNSSDNKYVIYPKEESDVVIGIVQNDNKDAILIQVSEIDSIFIQLSNDFKGELKTNGDLIFNDGSLGGLIKIDDLTSEINSRISGIKAAVAAGFTAQSGIDASAGVNAFNAAWPGAVQNLVKSAYENTKIKH